VGKVRLTHKDGRPFLPGEPGFGQLRDCPDCTTAPLLRLAALDAISSLRGWLLNCTFENFEKRAGTKEAYEAAAEFARRPVGWVTIYGPVGNGKTHLAAAAANALRARVQPVLFVNVVELLHYFRDAFDDTSADRLTFQERFDLVKTAPILFLDDFGAETETAWVNERLYEILNYRTEMSLPTFITTNLKLEELARRISDRLSNRLLAKVVKNAATSYRTALPGERT